MKDYGTLKQAVYLSLFLTSAGILASFTVILKALMLCGLFKHSHVNAGAAIHGPIS